MSRQQQRNTEIALDEIIKIRDHLNHAINQMHKGFNQSLFEARDLPMLMSVFSGLNMCITALRHATILGGMIEDDEAEVSVVADLASNLNQINLMFAQIEQKIEPYRQKQINQGVSELADTPQSDVDGNISLSDVDDMLKSFK